MLSALLAAIAFAGASPGSCPATTVRYEASKHPTLSEVPWVLARPQEAAVIGHLVSYPRSLRDGRVNRRDGLVLWRTQTTIVWNVSGTLAASRLDGRRSFSLDIVESSAATLRFPATGCWRLRLRGATVVARVVAPPRALRCDATPVERPGSSVFARPRSSEIRGGWGPWWTAQGGAMLYTHGHHVAGAMNMKVLWRVAGNATHATDSLELVGTRLDGDGSFRQEFVYAPGLYPSIVDVPAPGCWLFRLRTGRHAGAIIVRAIDG